MKSAKKNPVLVVCNFVTPQSHRYPTCGDWQFGKSVLNISVSRMPWRNAFLVAMHEWLEAMLCEEAGISQFTVSGFDLAYTASDEPGDNPACPYHKQHAKAIAAEKAVAKVLGVNWQQHESRLEHEYKKSLR